MKSTIRKSALLTGMIVFIYGGQIKAQFLKRLLNDVQQTAENRADNKATSTTNKALDKVDNSTQSKPKTNNSSTAASPSTAGSSSATPADKAASNSVLGAFAKAAQQNPNDTSAADLTMKALGLLAGGGAVSAADSAAAIKSFTAGAGGSGILYQSITTTISSKAVVSKDTATVYFTNTGSGRSEMRINIPGAMSNKMITIGHAANPKYSVSLYPDTKTYSLNVIDSALINSGISKYQVTRVGTETVQGYRCVHSKLTSTTGSGVFKSSSTMDLWTSTEVPGYDLYKKLSSVQGYQTQMIQALDRAGCSGYILKMTASGNGYSMNSVLIKAEKKSFPDSLFEIPPGYSQSKGNMFSHMVGH
ncbi:MAG: DUF4412 domain-containing protein [Bacteroidota bacterium]|nr:DUF4412 domain-containing protein [Bacteroidota bacterium]MDP4212980.1 DUF4412 domain-containing protein [Bacteroidota bacterium]MDP4250802.1 DUF4412 domain-containing protein [Bacteroidota bacterium]